MGANEFETIAMGKNAADAFHKAVEEAQYAYGHAGYTGTIAEKTSFKMIPLPEGKEAVAYADSLLDSEEHWVNDKWGPAGCIELPAKGKLKRFLFFGVASS